MLRTAWQWLKDKWAGFEAWVAGWLPGLKTKIVTSLGVLGNTAFVLKSYIEGLPLSTYINTENLLIANMILFTLAFWFRGLADRED